MGSIYSPYETYVDLTEVPGAQDATPDDPQSGVRDLARRLKAAVQEVTGLSCSIGVSPNKLLSKIGSDLDKPDGLTLLTMADLPTRIWPLPASKINGIGPKANARLAELGIQTIGELAAADLAGLIEQFGDNYGHWLHRAAQGQDERPVVTHHEPKSLSRETTFERDLHARTDRDQLSGIFTRLCEQVADDLRRKGYVGKSVGIKLRFDDFKIVTRSCTLPDHTQDAATIRHWAGQCLKTAPLDKRLRLLGVKVDALCRLDQWHPAAATAHQVQETLPLFDDLA